MRSSDTLARFGGDEFTILCDDVDSEEDAREVARRLVAAMGQPLPLRGGEVFVSLSVGIAVAVAGAAGHGGDAQRRHRHVPGQRTWSGAVSRCTGPTTSTTWSAVSRHPTSCTEPSSETSWSSTTNPSSISIPRRWSGWRHWCDGGIPPGGCSCPKSSSVWPRTAARSSPSGSGSCEKHVDRRPPGTLSGRRRGRTPPV